MQQKYIVYFNRKGLLFNNPQGISAHSDEKKVFPGSDISTIENALNWLNANPFDNARAIVPDLNIEQGLLLLKSRFNFLRAAGGIVKSRNNRLLFIHRLGVWDLPKGKVEKEETVKVAAEREIIEETGITGLTNEGLICLTWHTYTMKGREILKETAWYAYSVEKEEKLIPQTEEDITEAKWVEKDQLNQIRENTYPSIIDVIEADKRISVDHDE